MASSEQDYILARSKRIQRLQKIFAMVSIVSFFGSGVVGAAQFLQGAFQPVRQEATSNGAFRESQMKEQERGYELVLQREPENQVALEGLVNTRLKIKDGRDAIEPLNKLIRLYPDRQDYKVVLAQLKRLNRGSH